MAESLLRRNEVLARTGLARSTLFSLVRAGRFPAPIPLHGRAVAWIASDVDRWIDARIAAARDGETEGKT